MTTAGREADEDESDLFLVLDGGGARGIAHVAMWRALEGKIAKPLGDQPDLPDRYGLRRYRLAGVAGTSAGAVAAAFIAAGARASDLIDTAGRPPLCTPLGLKDFHALFGIRGWRRLEFLRRLIKPSEKLKKAVDRFERDAAAAHPADPTTATTSDTRASTQADSNARRARPAIRPIDHEPTFWFVTIATAAPVVFSWGQDLGSLFWPPPYSLLLFLVMAYASTFGTSKIARSVEKRRTEGRNRGYGRFLRKVLHPFAAIGYALIFTVLISAIAYKAAPYAYALAAPYLPTLPTWGINIPGLYRGAFFPRYVSLREILSFSADFVGWLLFGFGIGATVIHLVRDFVKGGASTDLLQRDFDQALRILLTQECKGWDENAKRHVWVEKENLSARLQLIRDNPDQPVTFDDLFDATKIQLTVVAADTIENSVCTYSSSTDKNMSVAKAVSASLAIPFAFQHVRYGQRLLVDGGLVSSIPAWVFRRHRNRDPDCKILAVRIEPDRYDRWIPKFLDYRKAITDTTNTDITNQSATRIDKRRFVWRYTRLSINWPFGLFFNILEHFIF